MARLRIAGVVDEPGYQPLPPPDVHVGDEGEIAIAGLKDGTEAGLPSLALSPSGQTIMFETTWRMWSFAHEYFRATFGEADLAGMAVEVDMSGQGGRTRFELLPAADIGKAFFECELCHARKEASEFEGDDKERQMQVLQWGYRHFREKHPDWTPPGTQPEPSPPGD